MAFHIAQSGKSEGNPVRCPAKKSCTLKNDDGTKAPHFTTKEEGLAHIEKQVQEEAGNSGFNSTRKIRENLNSNISANFSNVAANEDIRINREIQNAVDKIEIDNFFNNRYNGKNKEVMRRTTLESREVGRRFEETWESKPRFADNGLTMFLEIPDSNYTAKFSGAADGSTRVEAFDRMAPVGSPESHNRLNLGFHDGFNTDTITSKAMMDIKSFIRDQKRKQQGN